MCDKIEGHGLLRVQCIKTKNKAFLKKETKDAKEIFQTLKSTITYNVMSKTIGDNIT